jgi:hypothetical protein
MTGLYAEWRGITFLSRAREFARETAMRVLDSFTLHREARRLRSEAIGRLIGTALESVGRWLTRLLHQRRNQPGLSTANKPNTANATNQTNAHSGIDNVRKRHFTSEHSPVPAKILGNA